MNELTNQQNVILTIYPHLNKTDFKNTTSTCKDLNQIFKKFCEILDFANEFENFLIKEKIFEKPASKISLFKHVQASFFQFFSTCKNEANSLDNVIERIRILVMKFTRKPIQPNEYFLPAVEEKEQLYLFNNYLHLINLKRKYIPLLDFIDSSLKQKQTYESIEKLVINYLLFIPLNEVPFILFYFAKTNAFRYLCKSFYALLDSRDKPTFIKVLYEYNSLYKKNIHLGHVCDEMMYEFLKDSLKYGLIDVYKTIVSFSSFKKHRSLFTNYDYDIFVSALKQISKTNSFHLYPQMIEGFNQLHPKYGNSLKALLETESYQELVAKKDLLPNLNSDYLESHYFNAYFYSNFIELFRICEPKNYLLLFAFFKRLTDLGSLDLVWEFMVEKKFFSKSHITYLIHTLLKNGDHQGLFTFINYFTQIKYTRLSHEIGKHLMKILVSSDYEKEVEVFNYLRHCRTFNTVSFHNYYFKLKAKYKKLNNWNCQIL